MVNILLTGFKTLMIRSDLCDYTDAYIVVKGRTTVEGNNAWSNMD